MRPSLVRSLHTSRVTLAFRRSTVDSTGSSKRTTTPRKQDGDHRLFEKASAYWYNKKVPSGTGTNASKKSGDGKYERTQEQTPNSSVDVDVDALLKPATVAVWPGEVIGFLHRLGSFKPDQQNELFCDRVNAQHDEIPSNDIVSLIRRETRDIWEKHFVPGQSLLLTGDGGVGKSSLLTQSHAAARMKGWAVIHLPQAELLLNGSTDAVWDEKTGIWKQPMFVRRLLKKTLKANRHLLQDNNADASEITFLKDFEQLFKSSKVLVTVDNLNAISTDVYAENADQANRKLYHDELEAVNTLLRWIEKPPSNFTVIGATTGSCKPIDFTGYAYASIKDFDPQFVGKVSKSSRINLGRPSGEEVAAYVKYLQERGLTTKDWRELYQEGNGSLRSVLDAATKFAY